MLLATMCLWFGEKKFNLEKPEAVSKRFRRLKGKNMRQRNNGMNGHSLDLEPLHGHRPTDNKIVKLLYSSSKY